MDREPTDEEWEHCSGKFVLVIIATSLACWGLVGYLLSHLK